MVEIDEAPRRDTSLEVLAKLPGLVGKEGTHTAGNSPGVNDAGGALVVASDEWAKANGREALGEIVAHAQSGDDFAYLARTPASAATKALQKAGLKAADIDVWEINEAFASVTLNSIRMLGIDEDRVNVNGGAIALGHPIGASGARILGCRSCTSCAAAAAASAAPRSAPAAGRATRSSFACEEVMSAHAGRHLHVAPAGAAAQARPRSSIWTGPSWSVPRASSLPARPSRRA